ncbi:MAG: hypothetical protein KDK70_26935, partial [Myxococcales bacterium]|nr:hypothetical protein [Myxococcales bacterium]
SALEQMQGHEIAEALGLNVNTVHARIRSARTHISRRARRMGNLQQWPRTVALHRGDQPRPAAVRRAHAAVLLKVGATASGWKAAAVIAMLGTSTAVAARVSMDPPPTHAAPATTAEPEGSADDRPTPRPEPLDTTPASTVAPSAPEARAGRPAPPAPLASPVEPDGIPALPERPAAGQAVGAAARRRRSMDSGRPDSSSGPEASAERGSVDADLVDEMRRLRSMRARVERGDAAAFAEQARAYHRAHPHGTLAEEVRQLEDFSSRRAPAGAMSRHENDRDPHQ